MNITLRFFASVREALGTSHEDLTLPPGVASVAQLRRHLAGRGGAWALAMAPERTLRMAHNQVMCKPEQLIAEGAEVAFFPPVTGG